MMSTDLRLQCWCQSQAPELSRTNSIRQVKDIEPERQESVSLENTALVVDDSPEAPMGPSGGGAMWHTTWYTRGIRATHIMHNVAYDMAHVISL